MSQSSAKPKNQIRSVDDWVPWLAGLLQFIAGIGWVLAYFAGAFALGGLVNAFPEGEQRESWRYFFWFAFISLNYAAAIFGWPLCFVLAWVTYFRRGKANRRRLLLITSLPYLHVAIIAVGLGILVLVFG